MPIPVCKPAVHPQYTPVVVIVLVKVLIKVSIMHIYDHYTICCILGVDCGKYIWFFMGFSFSFMGFSFIFSDLKFFLFSVETDNLR